MIDRSRPIKPRSGFSISLGALGIRRGIAGLPSPPRDLFSSGLCLRILLRSCSLLENESEATEAFIQSTVPSPSSLILPLDLCSRILLRRLLVSPMYLMFPKRSLTRYSPGASGGADPSPVNGFHLFGLPRPYTPMTLPFTRVRCAEISIWSYSAYIPVSRISVSGISSSAGFYLRCNVVARTISDGELLLLADANQNRQINSWRDY